MSTSFRRTAFQGFLIVPVLISASVTAADAQRLAPDRFESATRPPSALAIHGAELRPPARPQPTTAPLPRIVFGTAVGGALGGAAGGAAGAAIGRGMGSGDDYFSPAAVLGVLGLAVGYPIGAAIGARMGATVDGARPALPQLLVVSAVSTCLGGFVWSQVGERFESDRSMASWHLGAVAGFATHLAITSLAAQRAPAVPARVVEPARDPGV